jgi:hypothetical protein
MSSGRRRPERSDGNHRLHSCCCSSLGDASSFHRACGRVTFAGRTFPTHAIRILRSFPPATSALIAR